MLHFDYRVFYTLASNASVYATLIPKTVNIVCFFFENVVYMNQYMIISAQHDLPTNKSHENNFQ